MTDNKRIAKNTIFLYFRMLLIMGASLYTSRVILRTLGVDDYGIYNVVGGIVTMFAFLNGSLGAATSRYITFELGKKNYERLNNIFNVALLVHIFIALIIIVLAETVGLWFFYNKMVIPESRLNAAFWVYQISILTSFFSMTQIPYNAVIIAHENMKVYAYVGIVEALAMLFITFLVVVSPFDKLIYYAILLCILRIAILTYYRFFCNMKYKESDLKFCKEKTLYYSIFKFAGSDMIGAISVMAQGQGLNLLLNVYFGPAVNAARAIAYQVQGAVTQFSSNFMTAIKPQIIKSYAEGKYDDMWKLVIQGSCFSFYLMWMICLPLMLEAETVLKIWLGDYPDHSVSFLILILILCLIQTIKTPRVTVFHALAKVFASNITVGIVLCLVFPISYILLEFGSSPESVFWAANITFIISEFVSVLVLRRYIKFSVVQYICAVHGRCLFVALISLILPYYFYDKVMAPSFLRLIITCFISIISVALSCLYLGVDMNTRRKLYNLFVLRIKRFWFV